MVDRQPTDNSAMTRLRLALERELQAGETVEWHGWQLAQIDPKHFLIYVFAVPWTAFALAWTGIAATAVAGGGVEELGFVAWAFPLFGVPFIAVGAWMLSRPFLPLWERGRVLYVVTASRVLKLAIGRDLTIDTAPADRIGMAQRRERPDGSGWLRLAVRIGRDSDGDRQTEYFDIGPVADVAGAGAAIERLAAGTLPAGSAATLSS
ncbi:MAG: hypothetical protein NBV68_10175 [Erythrobacter sp.]|uniref:hypothetical protein n=1 Tax=Erythrobacter sp. TaxID=1042 RepID=UPI0025EF8F25|nr:hypothetical protein [Erythrobacter sp.]MCL9999740.1 hypothetical protein [Erythrobacter sp.]